MKRIGLHLLFWFLYFCQSVTLIFLLNTERYAQSANQALFDAITYNLVLLIPKLALAYFVFYFLISDAVFQVKDFTRKLIILLAAVVVSVLIYRALVVYFVNPFLSQVTFRSDSFINLFAFLVALMDIAAAAGTAIVIKLFRVQQRLLLREKNLIKDKLESELRFLKAQTSPHFLFNTLNNIYGLARKKSDKTAEVVMRLSKILRFVLYETNKKFIRLHDEVQMIENYIELERIRYGDRLEISLQKSVDGEGLHIAPLLLLGFVENAFKHGPEESSGEAFIRITLKVRGQQLDFRIENSKEENASKKNDQPLGLSNIQRQLELTYKDYTFDVTNENNLFVVHLVINLEAYAEV